MTKIYYIDAFTRISYNIFLCLQELATETKESFKILFLGPDEKYSYFLSNWKVENAIQVWTKGHYVRKIYSYIKKNKPDIIQFSFELRTFGTLKSAIKFPILLYLIKNLNIKAVITIHNILVFRENSKWVVVGDSPMKIPHGILVILVKIFIKSICKFSSKIVVTTEAGKEGLIEYYGVDQHKIEVIREGFSDTPPINLERKKKFVTQFKEKKIILCFGVITPRKGLTTVIKAFSKIHEKLPNHILVIAGKSSPEFQHYEDMLHQMSKELELDQEIFFTGFVDNDEIEILFDMAQMTLYVYSQSAAGSGALHFAVQHARPAIVTRIDTFKEVLKDDEVIFVDPDNENQLEEAILKLASDEELRNSLQQQMKDLSSRTWRNVAEDYLALYEKITM
jgi:glycosyltransferase involved in cell wall biosynthesis